MILSHKTGRKMEHGDFELIDERRCPDHQVYTNMKVIFKDKYITLSEAVCQKMKV